MLNEETVQALLSAGTALAKPTELAQDVRMALVPIGYKIETLDNEKYNEAPREIRENLTLCDAKSFVDYFQCFATSRTVIFSALESRKFKAVFDYHQINSPAWGKHTATLTLKHSSEWLVWEANSKRALSQEEFAEFVQLNLRDVIEPAGADLLEVAQTLQAKKKVDFLSGIRLDNGQTQLTYSEVIEGTAGPKGSLKIPEKFVLALRVFNGMDRYRVEAFLRYRIGDDKKLRFIFQLDCPDRIVEDAFEQVKKQLEVGCSAPFYVTA